MEKLAEMSRAIPGAAGAVPKRSLRALGGVSVNDRSLSGVVGSLAGYAKRAQLLAAPEVGTAWRRFVARVTEHRAEMKSITRKIYMPELPGIAEMRPAHRALQVVRPTEPLRRFVRNSKDCVEVFASLAQDLGTPRAQFVRAAPNAALFGGILGFEVNAWVPQEGVSALTDKAHS